MTVISQGNLHYMASMIRAAHKNPESDILHAQATKVQADMIAWANRRFRESTAATIQGKIGYVAMYAIRSDAFAVTRSAELIAELAKLSR